MADRDRVDDALNALMDNEDVLGSAVVRRDGIVVTTHVEEELDEHYIATMTSSLLGSADHTRELLDLGDLHQVTLDSSDGTLVVTDAGETALLAVMVDPDHEKEDILSEITDTVSTIKDWMHPQLN